MPLCLSVRKCDYDGGVGSGSKWVFRLWSEWRHLDRVAGLEANVDRLGKQKISSKYFVLCGCANFSDLLDDQGQKRVNICQFCPRLSPVRYAKF